MIKTRIMKEYRAGVERLSERQLAFIKSELCISSEEISWFDDSELDKKVYKPMCGIEFEEILCDGVEESDRYQLASGIVTILGNSVSEANGWIR